MVESRPENAAKEVLHLLGRHASLHSSNATGVSVLPTDVMSVFTFELLAEQHGDALARQRLLDIHAPPGCDGRRGYTSVACTPVLAGQFIDAGVPEWCGARQTRRMYSAPTSTNAPQAQRQWRLCGHRSAAAPPSRSCS